MRSFFPLSLSIFIGLALLASTTSAPAQGPITWNEIKAERDDGKLTNVQIRGQVEYRNRRMQELQAQTAKYVAQFNANPKAGVRNKVLQENLARVATEIAFNANRLEYLQSVMRKRVEKADPSQIDSNNEGSPVPRNPGIFSLSEKKLIGEPPNAAGQPKSSKVTSKTGPGN
jgi:hypothetical protein